HRRVVQLDALVHFLLLDRGIDQPDHAEGFLVAALHGGLHVIGQSLLEAHRGSLVSLDRRRAGRFLQRTQKAGHAWACRLQCCSTTAPGRPGTTMSAQAQYRRWRLVTSRDMRRIWRFTAAAALRLRSWVGFS